MHGDGVRSHLVEEGECHDNLRVLVCFQHLLAPVRVVQTGCVARGVWCRCVVNMCEWV